MRKPLVTPFLEFLLAQVSSNNDMAFPKYVDI